MKILLLTHTFPLTPTDSTAHFMYDFAMGLSSVGHEVVVVLPYHPSLKQAAFAPLKLETFRYIWSNRLHTLGFGRSLKHGHTLKFSAYLLSPLYAIAAAITLYRLTKAHQPDLINAHWLVPNGIIAALVSRLTHTPVFITIPGSDAYLAKTHVGFNSPSKWATTTAAAVISDSPQFLSDLSLKGYVIPYGVPLGPPPQKKSKHPIIATAGRTIAKKGFRLLSHIDPTIQILNHLPINEFRRRLRAVDIFIALSQRDPQGNLDDSAVVVLEAMAAGCAVITTNLPGYRRIIRSGYSGILVRPKSPAIKRALIQLKLNPTLRRRLGNRARHIITDSLTPRKVAHAYTQIFRHHLQSQ